jgi:hypothetical protein
MHVSKQSVINHILLVSLREREREGVVADNMLTADSSTWKKICLLTTVRLQAYTLVMLFGVWKAWIYVPAVCLGGGYV